MTKKPTKPNAETDKDRDSIDSTTSTLSETKDTEESEGDKKESVILVYPGNINNEAMYKKIRVTKDMKTEQLVDFVMEKFHIPSQDPKTPQQSGVEYY